MQRTHKPLLSWCSLLLSCTLLSSQSFAAPPTIEIFAASSSGSGNGPANGPTQGPVTHTFLLNRNNPSDNNSEAYNPNTKVTYTVTSSLLPATPDIVMGGDLDTGSGVVSVGPVLQNLNAIGGATNNMFAASIQNSTGCSNGMDKQPCFSTNGGIERTVNQSVTISAMTKSLRAVTNAYKGRVKIGAIKIVFPRAVNNPILQVSGMGAGTDNTTSNSVLGFAAEFTFTTSNTSVELQRIAGNKNFAVNGNDIINTSDKITSQSTANGASGSVYIKGKGITELNFDIYIRGDGDKRTSAPNYSLTTGDTFFFGISSMDADSDVTLVKKQRVGKTATFVQTQLNDVPVNSLMQYQLEITNNTPTGATLGGTVANLPFDDTLPISLKDVSVVSTTPTTPSGASPITACSPTLTGNNTAGWKISGLFTGVTTAKCTIVLQGTATQIGTLSNTAYIDSTSSTTRVSSAVNANIIDPSPIISDPVIKEARFTITPDLPTIVRGRTGTQTINIKNEGPDSATNAKAIYVAAPQTGITVSSVSVVGGSVCTLSGSNWNCNLGNMANGATKQLSVTYITASNSALGTAQQATVKVSSDEFNPGSGVGETLYKVWGTNQQNEYRPNGAFWVGYEGPQGATPTGSNHNEGSSLTAAWPANQASPTGGYLVSGANGTNDSIYAASSTTALPTIQRIISNMSSDSERTVELSLIDTPDIGDNRRAWEFTTGVYIGSSSTLTLCLGNTTIGIDDGGYIMVDGGVVTSTSGWVSGGLTVTTSSPLSPGYHRITYRITNRNTHGGISGERAAGGYGSIGLSLGGGCSTANYDAVTSTGIPVSINIIDGAKIKIAKTSINGFGTFNFSSLTNLVNSTTDTTTDSVATVTAGTTATSTTQLWAKVLNTAISITEDTAAGYQLTEVSCTDANSAGTFGSLAGNILTIPANRITEGANITCTFTNTKVLIVDISGRVFNDNSGTTGDATKAYNAIQDAGEIGIANSAIRLSDCNALTIGTTTTNANGDYGFSIVQTNLPTSFCIAQTNLPEYLSVNADSITIVKTSATSYPNNNFADVKLNVLLTEDGQHTITAGEVTDYPHRLSTQAPVWVTQLEQAQSNSNNDQPWQALVYRDSDCNGTVDAGETVFNPSNLLLQPNADICLVQRVFAPTNIFAGAQHIGKLQASYAVAALSLTNQKTQQRQDVTLIGSAGLTLTKKVRTVSSCTSTPSDSLGFLVNNQATKQQNLEYEITYKNNSVKNLQNVKVKDSLPTGTNFGDVSCRVTPGGNTCNATHSGEVLEWTLTGLLKPSATGTLRFCVTQ
ncbi:hypothetical protein QSV37_03210 [Acinetobacter sp. VNK23]|nr:hypothetical protein [Acinetobacter thutiue]MDM1019325.1 hypothetical protein [Acinetobacter thutiue]